MRAAIITCEHEVALSLKAGTIALPQCVRVVALRECRAPELAGCDEVLIEGDGIPETANCDVLPRCDLVTMPDGSVELVGPWKFGVVVPDGAISLTNGGQY
jgi:hypothetical protein